MSLNSGWQSMLATLLESGLPESVIPQAEQLLTTNAQQWRLEDGSRVSHPAATLVALKQAIDESNRRRNDLIAHIDRTVIAEFRPPLYDVVGSLFRNSESVGRLLDRLSISIIRHGFLEEGQKLAVVQREIQYHVAVLRALLDNLGRGTASYAPEVDVKDYDPRRES